MGGRKTILLSHDALVSEDLDYLRRKPCFGELLRGGALVESLRSVYPTITYPAHTSLLTGCYPARTGIINNETPVMGQTATPWYWFRRDEKAFTLFDAAKAAGLRTAGVTWPVTGGDTAVDHLVAEYWPQREEISMEEALRQAGSQDDVLSLIRPYCQRVDPFSKVHPRHPDYDVFTMDSACDVLKTYNPDFMAIHESVVDAARHRGGVFSPLVFEALDRVEEWTAQLVRTTREMGTFADTNFILVSDHGQLDIKRVIQPNVLLRREGLIACDEAGAVTRWDAFFRSAGMSAQVYLRHSEDEAMVQRVDGLLKAWRDEGVYGISEVFTRREIAEKERLDGDFSFVVETDGYTSFGNEWTGALVTSLDHSDYKFGSATHGYLPDKGPQPVMLGYGPAFQAGVVLPRRPLVDVAPTVARVMGVDLPGTDGVCIEELLR
ncbi:MAG: alkaline phosphatase family protein [Eubacteriales bacterium]|nr:alkaline phosphatase family protein [Eubacteriales bacterium]